MAMDADDAPGVQQPLSATHSETSEVFETGALEIGSSDVAVASQASFFPTDAVIGGASRVRFATERPGRRWQRNGLRDARLVWELHQEMRGLEEEHEQLAMLLQQVTPNASHSSIRSGTSSLPAAGQNHLALATPRSTLKTKHLDSAAEGDGIKEYMFTVYHGMLWMRFPVAFFACALFCLAFVAGMISDLFFSAFTYLHHWGNAGTDNYQPALETETRALFIVLPFVTVLCGLLLDQTLTMFFDVLNETPLSLFRAKVLVGFFAVSADRPPHPWVCKWIDVLCIIWFEGWPLGRLSLSRQGKWPGYISGIVEMALVVTLVAILADMAAIARHGGRRKPWKQFQQVKRVIEFHRMRVSLCTMGGMYGKHAAFEMAMRVTIPTVRPRHRSLMGAMTLGMQDDGYLIKKAMSFTGPTVHGLAHHHNSGRQKSCCNLPVAVAALSILTWSIVCFLIFDNHIVPQVHRVDVSTASVLMYVSVLGLSLSLRRFMLVGLSYHLATLSIALIVGGLFLGTKASTPNLDTMRPLLGLASKNETNGTSPESLPSLWTPAVRPYPLCRLPWGGAEASLSSLDLAAIAHMAYEPYCYEGKPGATSVAWLLNVTFQGTSLHPTLEDCSPAHALPRSIVVYFPGRHGRDGTRVVAVRGTYTTQEIYADASLYSAIQLFRFIDSRILPVLSWLPPTLIQSMLTWNLFSSYKHLKSQVWRRLDKTIYDVQRRTMNENLGNEMVITGHSLGGVLAQISGSRLGIDTLSFSAPGSHFLSKVFEVTKQQTQRTINVIPEHDAVPFADEQDGVVQKILCRGFFGDHDRGPYHCHTIAATFCELWRVCGDAPHYRDTSSGCATIVNPEYLGKDFPAGDEGWWRHL